MRIDGRIQSFDPRTGEPAGDSWRVDGWPRWISVSPHGDRMAVTHVDTETERSPQDGTTNERREIRLAIVAVQDERVIFDEPMLVDSQVLLDDGDLIGLEDNRMGRYETEPLARVGTVAGAAGVSRIHR